MNKFSRYFLMDTEAAREYAVEALGFYSSKNGLSCRLIEESRTDFIFSLEAVTGRRLILKQADRLRRCDGRVTDMRRAGLEAEALSLLNEFCPGLVPELYGYDSVMNVIAMEDIFPLKKLSGFSPSIFTDTLALRLADFLSASMLYGTELISGFGEHRERAKFFVNQDMFSLNMDRLFGHGLFEKLSPAAALQAAALRFRLVGSNEAMLHGRLTAGALFTDGEKLKIINPKYAFCGPLGFDAGILAGSLLCLYPESDELRGFIISIVESTLKSLGDKLSAVSSERLYSLPGFERGLREKIAKDIRGYAGLEILAEMKESALQSEYLLSAADKLLSL